MQGLTLLSPGFLFLPFSHLNPEFQRSNGILADKKMYFTAHVPRTVSVVSLQWVPHTTQCLSLNSGFSVVNSLPACHALILGRKEGMYTKHLEQRAVHGLNILPGGHRAGSSVRGNWHV